MEIEKLRCSFSLWFANVIIILWIIEAYNGSNKVHPIKSEFFYLIIDLIMSSFP